MKVAVVGLWHLGLVIAASLAAADHEVIGLADDDEEAIALSRGELPIQEPGLDEAVRDGVARGTLRFTADREVLRDREVVWIAYDTPIDEDDRADVAAVLGAIDSLFPFLGASALVMISSQVPVGSTAAVERAYRAVFPTGSATFAYSPENLRLGQALAAFQQPDRVVVGVRADDDREQIARLLGPFTQRIEWMGVESAEMTKHALNAWLALSVAYINEIATLCEQVGADAQDVSRGLKSDVRIGSRAYLSPGASFAGGTLARDLAFLADLADQCGTPIDVAPAVRRSNDRHRAWPQRRLAEVFPDLRGRSIAILGLTYKPHTSTLRGSSAIALCAWLVQQGARVAVWDPAVPSLPPELSDVVERCASPEQALRGAAAAVVATEWPALAAIRAEDVLALMAQPIVLDASRFLEAQLGSDPRIRYVSVGRTA